MHRTSWKNLSIAGERAEDVERIGTALEQAADRAAQRDAFWGKDHHTRMTRLCWSFPSLVLADGVNPWRPDRLLRWLRTSGAPGGGARHAANFVLQVWNSETDWAEWARTPVAEHGLGIEDAQLAPFNVVDAIATWDDEHTDAFRTWCYLPFWP